MTARAVRSSQFRLTGLPLVLGRATTGLTGATCAAADTWYAMDISTMYEAGSEGTADFILPHPDWLATDIAGTDHKIEPYWPTGIYQAKVYCHIYSAACGTSHTSAEDFVIGLWDVQGSLTPTTSAELLWAETLADCPATQTDDTLQLDFVFTCKHDADLRFYCMNLDGAHNFEWDPIRMLFQVLV